MRTPLFLALLLLVAQTPRLVADRPPSHVPRLVCAVHGWHAGTATQGLAATQRVTHLRVPEGFTIERVAGADLLGYPMFITAAGPGRLYVFESTGPNTMTTEEMLADPSYRIRLLVDRDGDGTYDESSVFADRLAFPMGGAVVDGHLYVAAAPDLLRFRDTTGDGVADEREVVLTGWTLNVNGAAMGGPFLHPDGWLYITDARRGFSIARKEGDVVRGKGARIWRVRPDGTGLEWIAGGGFDNAVEIAMLPGGETIGTMTYFLDPRDGLRDALMHWVEGGVYPKPHQVIADDALPLTGPLMPPMTRLARVAHSGLLRYRGVAFGEAYRDNLFSAQFNTGRVMRHVVERDGATFRTVDEPFMTSDSADTHPTDVLEDADGSLLVVETGGWFIKGCPLSRVAKPEIGGGIYRIRRTGTAPVADPWGARLALTTAPVATVVAHLDDDRPAVRDAVVERLVSLGDAAIPSLRTVWYSARLAESRALAVFALHRIDTPAARAAVREALHAPDAVTRTAAARAVGLARDVEAVTALETLVVEDAPPVRRQAATALGQIGRGSSVPALIEAAARGGDRFVQHAIIHALITLPGADEALTAALTHAARDARRAALVALDQRRPSTLTRDQLSSFLTTTARPLWDTAVWVAEHRPEWADLTVAFVEARLGASAAETTDEGLTEADVDALLVTVCTDPAAQALVVDRLAQRDAPAMAVRMLDVMQRCAVPEWPAPWAAALTRLLTTADEAVRTHVLRLVEARQIAALDADVRRIAADGAQPPGLRLEAARVMVSGKRPIDADTFALVTSHLAPGHPGPVRQRAAQVLSAAALTDAQLETIARDHVATTDPFLLPRLVDAFEGQPSGRAGRALVAALQANTDGLDQLSEEDLSSLLASYPQEVAPQAAALLRLVRTRQADRLARLQAVEATLGRGDIDSGRRLFFGKSLCSTCHAVGARGGRFGPDLTTIGDIRSRHDIVEAILFPSASFAREYDTYRVRTATATHTGILKEQAGDVVALDLSPDASVRLPRGEVTAIEPLAVSMMPPGLDAMLTPAELADLVAFLESLPDPIERPARQGR